MASTCSANYVDRLLKKIDGGVCSIWNSLFFTVEKLPESETLFSCMKLLIDESLRLKSIWSKKGWQETIPDHHALASAFQYDELPMDKAERIHIRINSSLSLEDSLPFILSIGRINDSQGTFWLIGFQLHHAAGDGRALTYVVQRYWDLLSQALYNKPLRGCSLVAPQITDKTIIKKCLTKIKTLSYLFKAQYRQLARRADSLSHQSTTVGIPHFQSLRIPLLNSKKYNPADLFHSAILAAIASYESSGVDKLIRLRIPVDLRGLLDVKGNSVENCCAAVMVELPLKSIQETYKNKPGQLAALFKKSLFSLLKKQMYWANALECLIISYLSKEKVLKKVALQELLAAKRSSTLVVTHMGDITQFIKPPEGIKVLNTQSHTPVWGANSYVYEDSLYINVTCFDAIWDEGDLSHFVMGAKNWLLNQYNLSGEIL